MITIAIPTAEGRLRRKAAHSTAITTITNTIMVVTTELNRRIEQ